MINRFLGWFFRHWIPVSSLALAAFVLWLFYSYGFVKIELSNPQGTVSYEIVTIATNSTFRKDTDKTNVRKLVKRGTQEITVTNNGLSHYQIVTSGGFLGTTTVIAEPKPQVKRTAIGYNPSGCMFTNSGLLYSYECAPTSVLSQHTPATDRSPSIKKSIKSPVGILSGSVSTVKGLVLIGREPVSAGSPANNYTAFLMGDDFTIIEKKELTDLGKGEPYRYISYRDGFIAHNQDFSRAFYYSSVSGSPVSLSQAQPTNNNKEYSFAVSQAGNNTISLLYTEGINFDLSGEKIKEPRNGSSIVRVITDENQTKEYVFNTLLNQAAMCGDSRLCVVDSSKKSMTVYDVSGGKPRVLYGASGVDQFWQSLDHFMIQRNGAIMQFDAVQRKGSVEFGFSGQQSCGLDLAGERYFVCVKDKDDQNLLLEVDPGSEDSDQGLDFRFLELQNFAQVKSLWMYKQSVLITLDVRNDVRDPVTGRFGYDETQRKGAREFVDSEISRLGLTSGDRKITILP